MATLTIPAAYLEDVQSAAAREVADDSEALRTSDPQDRAMSALVLRRDAALLSALYDATGDIDLTAVQDNTSDPLVNLLEALIRQLAERMQEVAVYGPIPIGDVLDLAERVRWAANEAIRIDPQMNTKLTPREQRAA